MGALTRFAFFILIPFLSSPPLAAKTMPWSGEVREASRRFRVPEEWIVSVIGAESGGRELLAGKPIVSRAGAMGLMQLMPGTWAEMRAAYQLGQDPFDARDNILAGTAYLRVMYDHFGYPGLFAAYNAGPSRYSRLLKVGEALPEETIGYLAKITTRLARANKERSCHHSRRCRQLPWESEPSLFAFRRKGGANPIGDAPLARAEELTAIKSPR